MLKGMRKNAKRVLWPLTILIIIGMGGWGSWYIFQQAEVGKEGRLGSLWGKKVSPDEYRQAELGVWLFGKLTGHNLEEDELIPMTWRRLLLTTEAERLGITTTRNELINFIASLPLFHYRGRFSQQLYQKILSAWRINELGFEDQMKQLLAVEKLKNTIQAGALVSPAEVDEFYRRAQEDISIQYVEVSRDDFAEPVEIPEAELTEFYRKNPALFTLPVRVKIEYFLLPRERFKDTVQAGPEEIDAAWEAKKAGFTEESRAVSDPEGLRRQVKEELIAEKIDAEVARVSDEIDRMLIDVNDLDPVAEKYSIELEATGFFSADEPIPGLGEVEEIRQAAFSMLTGDISYPIIFPEGVCFFQLLEKSPEHALTFADSRARALRILNERISAQEAAKVARDEQAEVARLQEEDKLTFAQAAEKQDLTVTSPAPFSRQGSEEVSSDALISVAFLTPVGETSPVFPTRNGYSFLHVEKITPPPPFPADEEEEWTARARRLNGALVYNDWFQNLVRESHLSMLNLPRKEKTGPPRRQ